MFIGLAQGSGPLFIIQGSVDLPQYLKVEHFGRENEAVKSEKENKSPRGQVLCKDAEVCKL